MKPGSLRRSVTVTPELNTRLRDLIAACLRHGIVMDYTKALNLLAELGESWVNGSPRGEREKFREVWNKYLDYEELEQSEALADWRELEEFRQWKLAKAKRAEPAR